MSIIRSRRFLVLLVVAAVVGLVVSFAAWGFLELVHQIQTGVFTDLPKDLGYDNGAPMWWYLLTLGVAGGLTAFAIVSLPGIGGHLPAKGLQASGFTKPIELPGVLLAAFAGIGLGVVLGPEAPLIALGGGLAVLTLGLIRKDSPPQLQTVVAAAGTFAALSMIFESPLIAAVILIEATGLGGPKLSLVLLPGLLAAGIGSLVSIGMGSWTGLSTKAYALPALSLPAFDRPDLADFAWTIPFAIAIAVVAFVIFELARRLVPLESSRPFLILPVAGLVVAGLGIAFHEAADHGVGEVLFSGQSALGSLVSNPGAWSLSALALLVLFKGLAYSISLAGFRGGPIFPSLFLGAAGGLMAAKLPGYSLTPAVAVGLAAAVAAVLRLPLAAIVLATLLTASAGAGATPLVVVGAVVAYLTSVLLFAPPGAETASEPEAQAAEGPSPVTAQGA
ncbi:MAG: chloride channel protein [Thermoleophilaceae bacterium]